MVHPIEKSHSNELNTGERVSSKCPPARLIVLVLLSVLIVSLAGCNKPGGNSEGNKPAGNILQLKYTGVDKREMPVKSGYAFADTKTFTDVTRKMTTAASYRVYAASYDLDSSNFAQTMDKPLASDDQLRVTFSFVGDAGGNDKSPAKAGDYSAKADKYMKVEDVSIVSRKSGADDKQWFDRSTLTGTVKITSVSGDTITGEVDLSDKDRMIKGPFTAKILARK